MYVDHSYAGEKQVHSLIHRNWGEEIRQQGCEGMGLAAWNEMHSARFERSPYSAAEVQVQLSQC